MEQLLHYCWKHKMFPLEPLKTTDGQDVEVIDPGLYNRRNSGPDFFNAKVKINGTLWVGNVEIHQKASDWYQHGHDHDAAYNNVVLHVCSEIDTDVRTADGNFLPQMTLKVPAEVSSHYQELLKADQYPPCYRTIPSLTRLMVHSWMSALQTERLEQKTQAIGQRVQRQNGSWEVGYFMTLAQLYYSRKAGLSQLLECETTEQLAALLSTQVTPYWETHYTFGSTSCKTQKHLSPASLNLLMVNTAIPMLFFFFCHKSNERLFDRAFDLLEQLKAENNHITRMWQQCGLEVKTAGDSQALIQLKREYCDRKDCLRCRFGYEYLKGAK